MPSVTGMSTMSLPPRPVWARVPGVVVMLAVLAAVFTLGNPAFAGLANLTNILSQSSVLMLIALPMTLVIMTEGLDLSIGAVVSLAAVVLSIVAVATGSVLLALIAGLAVGAACGAVNGGLVAWLGIPPFVATLGMLGVAQGLALIVTGGQSVVGIPAAVQAIYSGVPAPILLIVLAYAIVHALLYHTAFGSYVFALGGNREALSFAGVPQRLVLLGVYAYAGACAGIAGLVLTARLNAGHPTAGIGMEFDAIAAVAVGGTSFERGNGWLPGTLLGVIVIGVLSVPSSMQVCCVGLLMILAFAIEALRAERA
jgi:ribose transport system permease protein